MLLLSLLCVVAPQVPLIVEMDKVLPTSSTNLFSYGGNGVAFDGRTMAVGYQFNSSLELFELGGSGWVHAQTITPPDGFVVQFPGTFDVDGDVLVLGARGGQASTHTDRVFVYRRVGGAFALEQELDSGQPSTHNAGFGFAPAGLETTKVSGSTIVVGAIGLSAGPPTNHPGAVYVYEHVGGNWALTQRFGTADTLNEFSFGAAVDFDGERIVVGDPDASMGPARYGRAHVFERVAGLWTETAILDPTALQPTLGYMGRAVAIDGDVVAFGNGEFVGEVEIFERVGGAWVHRRRVTASGGALYFGADVEVEGSLVFVGAPGLQGGGPESEGRVYAFSDDANQWNEAARVEAFDKFSGQRFGANVAVTDRHMVIAAPSSNGLNAAVYGARYCPQLGTPYCVATPNSSGHPALICAGGSPVRAEADVRLFAHYVPASSFGYFLMSRGQAFVQGFGGSQGNLCLGGGQTIYRFSLFVLQSPSVGTVALDLPWSLLPSGAQIQAGETWNFQFWFRDANPGVTSNTSDALSIPFL